MGYFTNLQIQTMAWQPIMYEDITLLLQRCGFGENISRWHIFLALTLGDSKHEISYLEERQRRQGGHFGDHNTKSLRLN